MRADNQKEVDQMRDWQTVEIAGYHYYSNLGYRVFVSLVRTEHYDFVVEKGGKFKRVNVKLAFNRNPTGSATWVISISHTQQKKFALLPYEERIKAIKKVMDLYLVWIPKINRFIEMVPGFELTLTAKYIRIPNGYLEDIPNQPEQRILHRYELRNLMSEGLKRCTLCGKIKPLKDFRRLGGKRKGFYPNCKGCASLYSGKWARKNRDKMNTYRQNARNRENIETDETRDENIPLYL